MTRIADTSVLYAFFDADDKHHEQAVAAIQKPEPILLPREILVETVDLIGFRSNAKDARYALDTLLSLPHTSVADAVPIGGIQETFRRQTKLSLADTIVVQTCKIHGSRPLTFDHEIEKAVG